jgi:hypothetical protein
LRGAERPPTSTGYQYPNPANRSQERESFMIHSINRDPTLYDPSKKVLVHIYVDWSKSLAVAAPSQIKYLIRETTVHGAVFTVDENTGVITIHGPAEAPELSSQIKIDGRDAIFVVLIYQNSQIPVTFDNVDVGLPWGYTYKKIKDPDNNIVVLIKPEAWVYEE